MRIKTFVLLISFCILPFSASKIFCQSAKVRLLEDQKAMKREVLKKIPVQSDLKNAWDVMKNSGFTCSDRKKSSVSEYDSKGRQIVHQNQDFLICSFTKKVSLYVNQNWSIAIVYINEKVTNIFVHISLTGL
ncbi:MAG: hypothetical protein AB1757_29820 [Acidobacteriota bacterium]